MPLETLTPPYPPSPSTTTKPPLSLREADFGDGYSQVTPAGLNHIRRTVTLVWEALSADQAASLEAFFEAHGGYQPFLYALSGDTARQWRCKDWNRKRDTPTTISATLTEDFTIWEGD
jgi:phage-related protein